MSTGKLITDASQGKVVGAMKIPVGGLGDFSVSPKTLKDYLNSQVSIYQTDDPSIKIENGIIQDLTLIGDSSLEFNGVSGQYLFLRISGNYELAFNNLEYVNVNDWHRDITKKSIAVLIQWIDVLYIFGYDYEDDATV